MSTPVTVLTTGIGTTNASDINRISVFIKVARFRDANEILKVGEEIEAKIIGFEDNRITLSIKELLPAPEVVEEAPAQEGEAEATEKPKKSSRIKKFEDKVAEGEEKRERRSRKATETTAEPKEFISGSSSATLGDLFKGLK